MATNPLLALEHFANSISDKNIAAGCLVPLYQHIDDLTHEAHPAVRYGNPNQLNNGPMSFQKAQTLQLSQRRTPPYLFRIFSSESGGGKAGLNSSRGVRSHGSLRSTIHPSIYAMNEQLLSEMIDRHLGNQHDEQDDEELKTEFTSWSPSLSQCSILGEKDGPQCRLAVVDTGRLAAHRHGRSNRYAVFHVAQLWRAALVDEQIDEEYLIHGDVKGKGSDYFSMPFGKDVQNALDTLTDSAMIAANDPFNQLEDITIQAMNLAEELFTKRGPTGDAGAFIYAVATFLAMRYQHLPFGQFEMQIPRIARTILHGIGSKSDQSVAMLMKTWAEDERVMLDLVYTKGYADVVMATRVLRFMAVHWKSLL